MLRGCRAVAGPLLFLVLDVVWFLGRRKRGAEKEKMLGLKPCLQLQAV